MDQLPDKHTQALPEKPPMTADDRELARQHYDELPDADKKPGKRRKKDVGLTESPPPTGGTY